MIPSSVYRRTLLSVGIILLKISSRKIIQKFFIFFEMKKLLKIFFAALFVGITDAVNRCGEYIDKETVLVRRTTDGKFSAEISDDLAGSTVFGTGKGLFTHGRAIFLSRMLVNELLLRP